MNIPAPTFRKLAGFDHQNTAPYTRAKLFLFFVTCVVELRKDMTPSVIQDRLYDWGYEDIDSDAIQKEFENDPEIRSSKTRRGSYEINPASKLQIAERYKLKSYDLSDWRFKVLSAPMVIISLSLLIVFSIIGYHIVNKSIEIRDISWTEFKEKTNFSDKSLSDENRAKYILYFITEHIQFRYDMKPEILIARLHDQGYIGADLSKLKMAISRDHDFMPSNQRQGAYRINPKSIDKIKENLGVQYPKAEQLTINWFLKHIPLTGWVKIFAVLASIITASFGFGALVGYLKSKES